MALQPKTLCSNFASSSYVNAGKVFIYSMPQILHLKNESNNTVYIPIELL